MTPTPETPIAPSAADGAVEPLAIVGMSARFPGARDVDEFWKNLAGGVESIAVFDDDDLRRAGVSASSAQHPSYVRARGSLGGVDLFDAGFFGYTPNEAQAMDPQQRLFLEVAHAALENAGYAGSAAPASVGVYAGCGLNAYLLNQLGSHPRMLQYVGFDKDYVATRVSYKLNLKGPSLSIQTACSTSLVAVCQAAQALLTYQCDLALAGGVAVALPDDSGYFFAEGAIFSPDGHCRAFDADARGIVPGSGVGAIVLKRLSDALADGDTIHALLRGFGLNNDGAGKVGFTAPSVDGQAQAILLAQELAGITADTISYVEAHGTGTPLGDPVEISALTQAFRATTDRSGYCALGSVKSNIGHLDAAAGIASLIKTVLALRHRQLPPTLHVARPNPKIDFAGSPFYLNTRLAPWPEGPTPRRAGVSSFGLGGTNAHVVLEEAPEPESSSASRPWQVVVTSARSANALEQSSGRLAAHLDSSAQPLADVAFTLQTGRTRFEHRRAVVCRDAADAVAALAGAAPRSDYEAAASEGEPAVVFMFPGQGVQYAGMGAELYAQEDVFRGAIDDCAALARRDLDIDLRRVICATDEDDRRRAFELLEDTRITQPALFAVEYALAVLWRSWGLKPAAMIGHSLGEYVAACVAGVFDLGAAMRIVCVRAAAMAAAPPGAMLAVALSEADARRRLGDGLWLAAVNAPSWCVVAGERARIDHLDGELSRDGIPVQRLRTAGAFHSGLMRSVMAPLTDAIAQARPRRPEIPYISNLTGTWIREDEVRDPAYWARQITEPVRFADGVSALAGFGAHLLLEIGPGQTLTRLAEQTLPAGSRPAPVAVPSMPVSRNGAGEGKTIAQALATMWVRGVTIDWTAYYGSERRQRVELPTYPFERQRYWLDPVGDARRAETPRASRDLSEWFSIPSWKRTPAAARGEAIASALLFADERGLADAVAGRLRARGAEVTVVRAGRLAVASGRELTIDPSDASHYEWLAAQLRDRGGFPETVLHLWGVTGDDTSDRGRVDCEARCFYSLLHLIRTLGAEEGGDRRVLVVTDGAHDVTGHEALNPFKALALGPCRVAPQEYPSLLVRHVDVAIPASGAATLAAKIEAEATSTAVAATVALRGIDRWEPSIAPVAAPAFDGGDGLLRDGGVYLITGGFGGIGLEIARHLARTVEAPALVLTTREPFPDRGRWPERLARRADARTVQRIHAVQALEALGARVMVGRADVADEAAMRSLVDDVHKHFGAIDGVVHAAGVAGGGVIHLKTADAAARVLAPKVAGAESLARVLEGEPLSFIALCSSMTSLTGGFGQVDYCAANAYLDAFARWHTTRRGVFTVAINWDAWRGVGMAVDTTVPRELEAVRARQLESGIAPADGVAAFLRALHAGEPQVLVSPADVTLLFAEPARASASSADASAAAAPAAPTASAPRRPRPALQTPFAAAGNPIEDAVCRTWEDMLGVEPIGVHDSFFELGGHSVLAIQVVARLNQQFATRVPVARLYEGMTAASLAQAIRSALGSGEQVEAPVQEPGRDRGRQQKQQQQRRQAARQVERSVLMESAVPQGAIEAKTGERQ